MPKDRISSEPLAPAKGDSTTLFIRHEPARSGLDFSNELRRQHVIPYLYNGSGVAIGDYDADGLPDVYLVSLDGPNKLFRQAEPFKFVDVTEAAGGVDGGAAWGTMATFADIDDDGDLDLYVCNLEAPNLYYQNQGDGTFVERGGQLGLGLTAASTGAAFADYDNDGDLDLYLLTNRVLGPTLPVELVHDVRPPADTEKGTDSFVRATPRAGAIPDDARELFFEYEGRVFAAGQRDRLLRNDGYAKWTDVSDAAGIRGFGMGLSATWWDYDDDGWLDLYVANDLESPDQLYRNNRDGSFSDVTESALPHTAYFGMGSDFGDIDNDGSFDFCVADMSSRTHYMSKMLMGNMSGRNWFLENARPPQYMRNAVYLNTGTPRFAEAAYLTGLASTDWTWTMRFADLDCDGLVDLFATNGIPRFDNDPDADPEFRRLWQLGQKQQALELARNLPPVHESNLAFKNQGGYAFADVSKSWGLSEAGVSHGAALADLDRDGDLDIVINNLNAPASCYENRLEQNNRVLVQLRGRRDNHFGVGSRVEIQAGGITQTRIITLARGYYSAGEAVAQFGVGSCKRIDRLRIRWPSGIEQTFEDLPSNRFYTVSEDEEAKPTALADRDRPTTFASSDRVGATHRESPFNDFAAQPLLPHKHSRLGPGIAWGDANGDGRNDAYVSGAAGTPGTLLLTNPGGDLVPRPGPGDPAVEELGVLWIDVDSDGDLDLFVASGGVESGAHPNRLRNRLYLNDGGGELRAAPAGSIPSSATSSGCVAAADFDRDGDLDLLVGGRVEPGRYPEAPSTELWRNDNGHFVDITESAAPGLRSAGLVTSALWTDVDADGFIDLLIAAHWEPIRVFRNANGDRFEDVTDGSGLAEHRGLWNGLSAGDFDADGDLDYIATNLGWNTKYHASIEHPMRVFARDFDEDGTLDVIEAKDDHGTLLPVRGRSCSSRAMPFVGEKFKTFDAFAKASLADIYTETALASAREVRATTLANSVLENLGDGKFAVRALPRLAQISPGFGTSIADFDGDGHLDAIVAQNMFSPEPETGRLDGGLSMFLRGRGDLTFEPVSPSDSGIVIPGDAMSLTITDLDHDADPDLVFGINDGPIQAMENQAGAERSLAIELHSSVPGNQRGIGATLRLSSGDGRVQLVELRAGGGYLSQSSATAYFHAAKQSSELLVRWPDGVSTRHEITRSQGRIVVTRD